MDQAIELLEKLKELASLSFLQFSSDWAKLLALAILCFTTAAVFSLKPGFATLKECRADKQRFDLERARLDHNIRAKLAKAVQPKALLPGPKSRVPVSKGPKK
jgi:hypothetical protein